MDVGDALPSGRAVLHGDVEGGGPVVRLEAGGDAVHGGPEVLHLRTGGGVRRGGVGCKREGKGTGRGRRGLPTWFESGYRGLEMRLGGRFRPARTGRRGVGAEQKGWAGFQFGGGGCR